MQETRPEARAAASAVAAASRSTHLLHAICLKGHLRVLQAAKNGRLLAAAGRAAGRRCCCSMAPPGPMPGTRAYLRHFLLLC